MMLHMYFDTLMTLQSYTAIQYTVEQGVSMEILVCNENRIPVGNENRIPSTHIPRITRILAPRKTRVMENAH